MSNKDNWDDESGDEEELDPILKEGGLMRFNLNTLESEAPIEYNSTEIVENEEPEEGVVGGTPLEEDGHPLEEYPDDEWGGEGGDPLEEDDDDYEDELDDYDKKLGRYVSCR